MRIWQNVYVHPIWLLLAVAYVATGQWRLMALGYSVVLLHELSHVVVAQCYGLTVDRIELWPLGGMAKIAGLRAQDDDVEAMIAMAGPLQNFGWAAVGWLLAPWLPVDPHWMSEFITLNLGLGLLNLLPVTPLDGGHLAELILAQRLGRVAAEKRVRQWGRAVALAAMVAGLMAVAMGYPGWSAMLFGGFLYWGTRQPGEAAYWRVRDLAIRPVRFLRRPIWEMEDWAVRDTTPVGQVIRMMRPHRYHRIVVLDPMLQPMGTLHEADLLAAWEAEGPGLPVGQLVKPR